MGWSGNWWKGKIDILISSKYDNLFCKKFVTKYNLNRAFKMISVPNIITLLTSLPWSPYISRQGIVLVQPEYNGPDMEPGAS